MATDEEVKLEMLQDEDDITMSTDAWSPSKTSPHYSSTGSLVFPGAYLDEGGARPSMDPSGADTDPKEGRNMFFTDGVSRIDYIMAWNVPKKVGPEDEKAKHAREMFQNNLEEEGLTLELDQTDPDVHYCKVHAPWEVLTRYAEILKIKMKMRETLVARNIQAKYSKWEVVTTISKGEQYFETKIVNPVKAVSTTIFNSVESVKNFLMRPFRLNQTQFPEIKKDATLVFTRDREYLFDIPDKKELFFQNTQRSRIVDFILRRKAFGVDNKQAFTFDHDQGYKLKGIKKMLSDGFYSAAYPLHEGHWKPGSAPNLRKLLYDNWAYWKMFYKIQPLEYIRNYYGSKIGLYFAWLGFYTNMLVLPSIIGLIIFLYGVIYMVDSYPSKEICDETLDITMCPLCDYQCPYWKLSAACNDSEYSRMFDNNGTVFFAIFMSLWGTMFLEFWKRKQSVIQYKWDLVEFVQEEEPPRPEYLAKLANYPRVKENPITGMKEPHLPFWRRRFPIFVLSYGFMIFTMCLAVCGVVGVIAYRVSTLAALQLLDKQETNSNGTLAVTKHMITQNASLITTVTAACINLLLIIILNMIYSRVAVWLTDFECLRTQSEYDDSINIKLFALQFVNYYSSILYIAFFKGRLVGRPGAYNMAFGARQEECGTGGCLIELCIQLAIIMAGKQLIQNNIIEIVIPKTIKWLKRCYRRWIRKETAEQKAKMSAWEKDYQLSEFSSLYHEYLEMVLQFGFLTIFVAAFPLGPLCCLLNNIIEIRSDAMKISTDLRRPLADRAADIGIWYQILYAISRVAVVSNAFIIALTSDFIPRLVYVYYYSDDGSLKGYTNFTLSAFNTSDFEAGKRPNTVVDICWYKDFRTPPGHSDQYEYSEKHWHVLAARLAFVVVFENFVVVATSLIAYLIPDVPSEVRKEIRREAYVANEIVIKTELSKARGESVADVILGNFLKKTLHKPGIESSSNGNGSELRHRQDRSGGATNTAVDDVSESNI